MKNHSIISIFLPELGCPKQCIFCNQKQISGVGSIPTDDDVISIIERSLSTLKGQNRTVEIAFFGGSFTALNVRLQEKYLQLAQPYLKNALIDSIRISTRPDAISNENLDLLKNYGVKTIELGVQSFCDEVLLSSGRGYTSNIVYTAAEKINNSNLTLGMQMMIGLPNDNRENAIFTAKEIIKCGAKNTRIYPLLVLKNTELANLYYANKYKPLGLEYAIDLTAEILELFWGAKVNVLKIGLHPSDFLYDGSFIAGPWHPNFRQYAQSRLWLKKFEEKLSKKSNIVGFAVNPSDINSAIGPLKTNIEKLKNKGFDIKIIQDKYIQKNEFHELYC